MHSNPFPKWDGSELTPYYTNWEGATVLNLGKVVQVNIPESDGADNYFESYYARNELEAPLKFSAA